MNVNNPNSNEVQDLGNGCKLRHGRLECGYDQAPYVNLRRPPAVDYHSGNNDNNDNNQNHVTHYNNDLHEKHLINDKNQNESVEGLDENAEDDVKLKLHATTSSNHFTRCLEVKDRIIVILLMINTVEWIGEVQCKPHSRVRKISHIERKKLPLKHVSLSLEKLTPFGKFEFKHVINKRQAEVPEVIEKEVPGGTIDAITEAKEVPVETHSEPEVIITSIIKPIENGNSLSLSLPFYSELVITPAHKINEIIEKPVEEVVLAEPEPKPEVIKSSLVEIVSPKVEIIPKVVEAPPPPEIVEPKVVINAIETPIVPSPPPPVLPPVVTIPIYRTPSFSYVRSVISNEGKTFLYTDIKKIPLSLASHPEPVAVPVPEILPVQPPPPPPLPLPPPPLPPLPPVIKEDPPPKKENPNFFVKGSRLVLYVGSMMLQMLSKFVNGGFNINEIPIPIIPEVQ
ncbi:unnamed protein product [Danaus chrysippus]|uniref:(African queen) hypothetical protein n=1 Tax=Danaus chrysippus TaxID=151541 RepID=A0A8J2QJB4_9NEOP|nr:unnamed protein product [Danaus chrysippus]